jgi:hypothetical protein
MEFERVTAKRIDRCWEIFGKNNLPRTEYLFMRDQRTEMIYGFLCAEARPLKKQNTA